VASARRGDERIIATMFGGSTSAARNKRVAELLDMGFSRAPSRVAVNRPGRPHITVDKKPASQTIRTVLAVQKSDRPTPRPRLTQPAEGETLLAAADGSLIRSGETATTASTATPPDHTVPKPLIDEAVTAAVLAAIPTGDPIIQTAPNPATDDTVTTASAFVAPKAIPATADPATAATPAPKPRPAKITFSTSTEVATADTNRPSAKPVTVSRVSTSGDRHWGINVGTYASRYEAERVLLKTALIEIETLDSALRKVVRKQTGFEANFVGMDERSAALACQRLSARDQRCKPLSP
jgi:D-alanyl-D-alanine carboxypeptidase